MAKQKKAGKQKEIGGKKKPAIKSSQLLSLPPELRNRIWKTVVDIDLIHLFTQRYSVGAPMQVRSLGSVSLTRNGPVNTETICANLHQEQRPSRSKKTGKLVNEPKQPGALSWLRTNRQIYTEAKAIVYANLRFHICNSLVFSALISLKSLNKYPTNRTLSLCQKVMIEPGFNNGFTFVRGREERLLHGWENDHLPGGCACPWCFGLVSLSREFEGKLPALRALNLRLYFQCNKWQGAGPRTVPLPGSLPKLVCVDSEENVDKFVKQFCEQRPLVMFAERKIESVTVSFRTETLQHNLVNRSLSSECWCIGRSMDEGNLAGVAKKIESTLTNGSAD